MHTFLIAELASAHDGDWQKARRMIDFAAIVGFDAVKLQYWSNADRLAHRRRAPNYRDIYRRYQIPISWLAEAKRSAEDQSLEFICTTYLPEDIAVVGPYVTRYKVASFEAHSSAFVAAHPYDKPLIVSTGMMSGDQVMKLGSLRPDAKFLHCVSAYPAPLDAMQLRAGLQWCEGLSDHSANPLTGAVAVGAGASIIEVHIRLVETDMENPDYTCALSPGLARLYVEYVRQAERMMGDDEKRPQEAELEMMEYRVK